MSLVSLFMDKCLLEYRTINEKSFSMPILARYNDHYSGLTIFSVLLPLQQLLSNDQDIII